MPLPAGYFLNAYDVSCQGPHRFAVFALPGGDRRRARQILEQRLGQPVWIESGKAYAARPIVGAEEVTLNCEESPDLHRFAVREALRAQAEQLGYDTWLAMGELNLAAPHRQQTVNGVIVVPVLKVRLENEGTVEPLLLLIARPSVRWRFEGDLSIPALWRHAPGEYAHRLSGGGPRRGRVIRASEGDLVLAERGGGEISVSPTNYALVARPPLIYKVVRASMDAAAAATTYRQILTASGTLDRGGRPNQYAVKQRETTTASILSEIGLTIHLPDGTEAMISTLPVEIYAQKES